MPGIMSLTPTPDVKDDLALAIHEAAHAVAHYAVGWPFKLVSIVADSEDLGYVERAAGVPAPAPELEVVVLCAGSIGEDVLFHAQSWIKRDSLNIQDWAFSRLKLRAVLFPSNPATPEEQKAIEELVEKHGAGKLARVAAMTLPFRHPEQTAPVEIELTKWARVANRLVKKFWPQISKLAQALLERKVLNYQEVLQVLK